MPIYIAVDSSMSMRLPPSACSGSATRSTVARDLAVHLILNAAFYCPDEKIKLIDFSHNSSILLADVSSEEEARKAFADVQNAASSDLLSLFLLMRTEKADEDSTLFVITDACTFTPEEVEKQQLPQCHIKFACVLDEMECDCDQLGRFTVFSLLGDGYESCDEVKDIAVWRPLFISEFDGVAEFAKFLFQLHTMASPLTLACGMLSTTVELIPSSRHILWDDQIDIIGFAKLNSLGNPPSTDHHFVVELKRGDGENTSGSGLVALLCASLLTEETAAICRLGDNVYGTLCSLRVKDMTEPRLTVQSFPAGLNSVAWLPHFDRFSTRSMIESATENYVVSVTDDRLSKPSYSSMQRTFWFDQHGVQSDLQKLVRQLRKIPDRLSMFYSEVNRFHLYACAIGGGDILAKLLEILVAEIPSLDAVPKKHCVHVCETLRRVGLKDPSPILPPP